MRSVLLPLAMLAVCAAPVALAAPAPAAAPAATASSDHGSFFIQDIDPDDIVSYDGRMSVVDARMRQTQSQLALLPPVTLIGTTIPPITTAPVTTAGTTAPPVTTAPTLVDADSDGYNNLDDCNDADQNIFPGATEIVGDGIDQDCDGYDSCYEDLDHDGFGTATMIDQTGASCSEVGFSTVSTDCLDSGTSGALTAADINPDAIEACDGVDNDCDGLIDDADPNHEGENFYGDGDGDGYGAGEAVFACTAPDGTVANNGDCDDADIAINPDASDDDSNGVDDNCDGVVDGVAADDTDDVLDTADRGDGKDTPGCSCDTSSSATPAGFALALSFVGSLLARRRKV